MAIHFGKGVNGILRNHVGDEGEALGFLGQAVNREVDLWQGALEKQG